MLNTIVNFYIGAGALVIWICFLVTSVLFAIRIIKSVIFIVKNIIKFLFFVPRAEKISFLRDFFCFSIDSVIYFFCDSLAAPVYVAQSLLFISMLSISNLEKFGFLGEILVLPIVLGALWAIIRLNNILEQAKQSEEESKRANMWASRYCDMAKYCAELEKRLDSEIPSDLKEK